MHQPNFSQLVVFGQLISQLDHPYCTTTDVMYAISNAPICKHYNGKEKERKVVSLVRPAVYFILESHILLGDKPHQKLCTMKPFISKCT